MSAPERDTAIPIERVDPRNSALVRVDVQNDFCAEGGFYDKVGHDLAPIHAAVS